MNAGRNYNGPKVAKFLVGWSYLHLPERRVIVGTEEFRLVYDGKQYANTIFRKVPRELSTVEQRCIYSGECGYMLEHPVYLAVARLRVGTISRKPISE